jgi:Pectate lyase superfamily protein
MGGLAFRAALALDIYSALLGSPYLSDRYATVASTASSTEYTAADALNALSVKGPPFNAVGDGVADDAPAINAALAAVAAAEGGIVVLPPGTYLVGSTLNMPTTAPVELTGSGSATTIKLKDAANVDVISQSNFGTLTGRRSTNGVFRVVIRDLTIDGNKANNAAGFGIRLFGRSFEIVNVRIHSARQDCLWTEGNQGAFVLPSDEIESRLSNLKLSLCGGAGWTDKGPNDLQASNVVAWGNGTWGEDFWGSAHVSHHNTYLNGSGGIRVSRGGQIAGTDIAGTSAAGWGILIDSGSGASMLSSSTAGCNGCIGMEVRSVGLAFQGIVANSSTGLRFNGGGGVFQLTMFGNATWFDCTLQQGQVILDVYSNDSAGIMRGPKCWTGGEMLRLPALANNTTRAQMSSSLSGFVIGGWNPVFPASNATLQFGASQAPAYATSVAIDATLGNIFTIIVTDGNPFVIAAPMKPTGGQVVTIRIKNTFGALGPATFTAGIGGYRLGAAWVQPARGFSRSITFGYDGANWIELSRTSADVGN